MRLPGFIRFPDRISVVIAALVLTLAAGAADSRAAAWDMPARPRDAPLPRSANLPPPRLAPQETVPATPDAPQQRRQALAQGVAEVLTDQPAAGAARLADLTGRVGELEDVVAYYQGLGLYLAGQPDKARPILAPLAAQARTDFLGRDALYLSVLCAAAAGDAAETLRLSANWLTSPDQALAPYIWLRAAVAARDLGQTDKSQDFLRHLSLFAPWTRAARAGDALARELCRQGAGAPAAPDRDRSQDQAQDQGQGAKPCYDPDAPGNVLLRAEGLAERGQGQAALGLLDSLADADTGQQARAAYIRGKALYALRRTQAAREAFATAAAIDPGSALAPWALYHEARCLWRSLAPDDATRMEALLRQVLAAPDRDDRLREAASRHLTLLLIEQGRFTEALAASEGLAGLAVSKDLAAQGASLTALLRYVTGDYARAETELAAYGEQFPGEGWADGARYWRARALMALSREAEAAALLATVANGRPNTYYGGRAATVLRTLLEAGQPTPPAGPAPSEPRCPGAVQPPDAAAGAVLATAADLRQALLPRLAEMLLEFAARRAPDRVDLALAHLEAAAATGRRAAIMRTAWRTFGACLLRGSAAELAPLRPLLYPRAYAEQVKTALSGSGVAPDIVFSLIRQESFFDPRIVSGAGAVGLMQLMPDTARAVGKRLGLAIKRSELTDPDINIRLGTAFFLERLSRTGNLPAALAGYNAGENRVALWNKSLAPLGEELFIELIPYTETRDYVRRILANAMMYERLYAEQSR